MWDETAMSLLSRSAAWGTIAALFAFAYILAAPRPRSVHLFPLLARSAAGEGNPDGSPK